MRPAETAAPISAADISTNRTLLESPPFSSIHDMTATCAASRRVVTPIVLPENSTAFLIGEVFATIRPDVGDVVL